MSEGAYLCVSMSTGIRGCLLVSEGAYRCLCEPTGA